MSKYLAAAVVAIVFPWMAQAGSLPAYPFIHSTGTAYLHVVPDRGEIDFDISANDASPEAARAIVDARIAEVGALAAQQGISPEQIEIRDVRRELRKTDGSDPKAEPVYDLVCAVHLEVRDLAKWRALMSPLVNMKNLDHFATSFSAVDRDKLERELTVQAIKDAQRKADAMARGTGQRLGPASGVSMGQLKNLTGAIGLQSSNSDTNTDPAPRNQQDPRDLLMVVTLKMTQSVDVIYKIK